MAKPGFLLLVVLAAFGGCRPAEESMVDAGQYDSFWLWAGVRTQPALEGAREIYLLDGEIRSSQPGRYTSLRPGVPRLPGKDLWLVVRTDTLEWPEQAIPRLSARLDRWAAAGNRVRGLQVDFDARTRGVDGYAGFLRGLRVRLPRRYALSITGLMDWSANGDPAALARLGGVVDEVAIQTYQGRETIAGYQSYFERMRGFPIPFKVGLVQGGRWRAPEGLEREPRFCGYVVFLVNPER